MREKSKLFTLSIIIPTYNEALTIILILEKIIQANLPGAIKKEIWVIDDCSTDDTAKRVKTFIGLHPEATIQYIRLKENRGKGHAVRVGITQATGNAIIIQDADLEYDPVDYPVLLQPILSGEYKVVYGSRSLNKDNHYSSSLFYWGGRLVSLITSILFSQRITDEPTCYKMFDASVLKSISLTSDRFGFCPEVTAKLLKKGYKIKEVPINYYPRSKEEGKKIRWQDGLEAVIILVKNRFVFQSPSICIWWLVKNVILLAIAILLISYTFNKQPGYHWVYNGLLKGNMKMIKEYPNLTFDEKMSVKLGASYNYLHYIKQSTPENAIILYPSPQAFRKEGSPFTQEIYNKVYATRFLFPRKLILENELATSEYAGKITHIAIVNGEGIDKLPYQVDPDLEHAVVPVKPKSK